MQHNTIYGKTNKNYNENTDVPNHASKPPKGTIPHTAKTATIPTTPDTNPQTTTDPTITETYHMISPTSDQPDTMNNDNDPYDDIYHFIPEPTANTGTATSSHDMSIFQDTSDLLFDPQQYLQFSS